MKSTLVAVDIANSVFEVAVSVEPGKVAFWKRLKRGELKEFFAKLEPATVLLEACGSGHYWGRELTALGHDVRLIPAHFTKIYRHGNKTDRTDVKALLEAFRNEEIQTVPVKSEALQSISALHCARSAWVKTRTARINEIRGHLREFGFILPPGRSRFIGTVSGVVAGAGEKLPAALRRTIDWLLEELAILTSRIEEIEVLIEEIGRETPGVLRLMTIPGIGPLTATAASARIVNPNRFRSGRQVAKSFGLTPREHSSGNRRFLGAISKRGDRYLRSLLTLGARSVLRAAKMKKRPTKLEQWALDREKAIGHNRAAIAVANKLARLTWAVWKYDQDYRPQYA